MKQGLDRLYKTVRLAVNVKKAFTAIRVIKAVVLTVSSLLFGWRLISYLKS